MGLFYNYIVLYYIIFDILGIVDFVIEVECRFGMRSVLEDNFKVNVIIKFKFICYF